MVVLTLVFSFVLLWISYMVQHTAKKYEPYTYFNDAHMAILDFVRPF